MILKVNEAFSNPSNLASAPLKEGTKTAEGKEASFQSQLKRIESRGFENRINELAGRIFEQGESLAKKSDIKELKAYKKLISEFLDEALNSSHKFSKQSFLDRRGRHRVYAVIKKINNEVEQLTEDVLKKESGNIKILQRLEDIKGLILDLMI
jgi:uncharacterized protein YaaR (DUF327 family)